MHTLWFRRLLNLTTAIFMITMQLFGAVPAVMAEPSPTGASISTDLPDYPPGATVTLTGVGWAAGEEVTINVDDDLGKSWSYYTVVTAGEDGTFTVPFNLPTWFVANYSVKATGPISGQATTTFTDLNIGTYDQCSNDDGDGYGGDPGNCQWINGNLQRNNSVYMEGDATVQRLWLTDLTPGSTHTITLKYGTTKGGKHAYDYLTSWNWSEDWITIDNLCAAVTGQGIIEGCTTAAQTTYPIPDDQNVTNTIEPVGGDGRLFTMAGGTISAASTPQIVSGDYSGDSETVITVTYTVGPDTGSLCSTKGGTTTCGIMLWFGAHVSVSGQWKLFNGTTGAGTITGSPYHVALDKVDGAAVGQRDNQMQAEVVTYIPNGTIVLIKDAIPNDAQDFSFNLNNNSTIDFGTFYLDDDSDTTLLNTLSFEVPPGTWVASELMPLPVGWSLTGLVCTDPTNNTTVNLSTGIATIDLASLETVTCTYTDVKAGHIIVKKVTSGGDYSFEFEPNWGDNFFLSNGQTKDSGPLSAGTYSVAEVNVPSTWSITSATCDDGSPVTAISLQEGETVTCTFNNQRVYNKDLIVTKTANEAFKRTYTWDVSKSVDKTTANIPDGSSATFNYTVGVTHDSGTDSGWTVSGEITVSNPNTFDVTGVTLSDALPGGTCTVTDGSNISVAAGNSVTKSFSCTFTSAPGSGTNTATATWDATQFNTPTGTASGTANYDFAGVTPSISNGSVTVIDTLGGDLGPISYTDPSPKEFTYSKTFSGTGGTCTKYDNTATINENGDFAKQTVEVCVGKDLTVTKTATATLSRTYKWLIDKSVDDSRIEIAEGGTATFNYSVKVTPDGYSDSDYTLGGIITITNPNDWEDVTVDVTDTLDKGGTCTISEAAPYVVPKGGSLTLHYTCTSDGTTTKNTATVTWNKAAYFTPGDTATSDAAVSFTVTGNANETITVVDDKTDPANPVTLGTWAWANGEHTFTYSLEKQGVAGKCTDYTNIAVIDETDQSDSQTVTVCVGKDLTVAKTATASLNRTYQWLIDKSVDDTRIEIADGGKATFNYSVKVTPDGYTDSGWTVSGTITVSNPNEWEAITADVTDMYDGGICTVTGGEDVIIPAGQSVTLDYSCSFTGQPPYTGKNTATAAWNAATYFTPAGSASGEADVIINVGGETDKTITVVDDKTDPANPVELGTSDFYAGPFEFKYALIKTGVAGTCTDYTNKAVIDETGQSDSQTVTVCVGKDLTVAKTATASLNRTYQWLIDKSVDDTRIEIADGGKATFNYIVKVTPNGYTDSSWVLGGTITVNNPNDWEDVTVDVADTLDQGGTCTITEEAPYVVPSSGSLTLHYTCTSDGTTTKNTATVTWDKAAYFTPGASATNDASVTYDIAKETNKTITVVDDQTTGTPVTLGVSDYFVGPFTFTYLLEKQGVAGTCIDYTNTAVIDETDQSDGQKVTVCVGKDLTVTKTATGTFNRLYQWLIDKSVDDTRIEVADGGKATFNYTVAVTPDGYTDIGWTLGGTITVSNPNDWEDITADMTDVYDGGGVCTVAGGENVVIPAGKSVTLTYNCTFGAQPAYTGTNTATATWDAAAAFTPTGSASRNADVTLGLKDETNRTITVVDDKTDPLNPVTLGTSDYYAGPFEFKYALDKTGVAGTCTNYTNTAIIDETDQSASQTVTVCVGKDLIVSKTAAGSFDRVYQWKISKDVDKTLVNIAAGGSYTFHYTVDVEQTGISDSGWVLSGKITLTNPNDWEDITLTSLADAVDNGGTCTVAAGPYIVPKGSSLEVAYSCSYNSTSSLSGTNTATANWDKATYFTPNGTATGTQPFDLSQVGGTNKTVHVTDTYGGDLGTVTATDSAPFASATFTYTRTESGAAGTCTEYDNTATITETGQSVDKTVTLCVGQDLTVTKTAVPSFTRTWDWTITKEADATYNLFIGQSVMHDYKVSVTPNYTDSAWQVVGTITISNPNDWEAVNASVSDAVDNGGTCKVDEATVTVPANGSVEVGYTCTWETRPISYTGTNTATVTWDAAAAFTPNDTASGSQGFEFTSPSEVNPVITVGDDNLTDENWKADREYAEWAYTKEFACSSDPAAYTNGAYSYSLTNTATINETTGDSDTATVIVNCYAPVVSKSAAGTYDERHEWAVKKTVNPVKQSAFAGDTVSYEWTVEVTEETFEEKFVVAGEISVINPAPMEMVVDLFDELGSGTDAVIGTCANGTYAAGKLTIPANTTASCAYTATPGGRTDTVNNVTATLDGIAFNASAAIGWTANVIRGTVSLDDDQNPAFPLTLTDGGIWKYAEQYTCSSNMAAYNSGTHKYTFDENNNATVKEGEALLDSAAATTAVDCYIPVISKTAAGTYGERHEWDVEKTVTPTNQDAFAGATVSYEWQVVVTEQIFEESFAASGTITVTNPNPEDAMTVTLSDVLGDGTVATITTCTGDTDLTDGLTIAAGSTDTCAYSTTLSYIDVTEAPTSNTATVKLNDISYSASDPIEWTATITRASAKVTDDQIGLNETITEGQTFTGSDSYTCSSDVANYAGDGTDTFGESNTAIVTSDGAEEDRDSATETITCYAPVISKTAAGTYDERHEWDVEKTVSPEKQSGFAGDTLPFTWTITVTESVFEENFDVAGSITVTNPAPMPMTVALADVLSDSTAAVIGACTNETTYADGSLTIPANTTTICGYTASDLVYTEDTAAPTGNTATATLNGIAFSATDPVEWAANIIRGEAELVDLQGPLSETITGSGSWEVKDSYTCSTDTTKYTTNYSYTETILNTATVSSESEEQDSSTVSTAIACFVPEISKTAAGAYDERHEWDVEKTVSPSSQSAFAGETVDYTWEVVVTEQVFEENFVTSGTITIVNHNAEDAMTVALSDVLSDDTVATITTCTGDLDLTDGLTIAAGITATCNYTASLNYTALGGAPTNNTATAVLNGISYSASDPIEWTATVTRASATVTDDQIGLNETITEDQTFTGSEGYTCSTNAADYADDGAYTFTEDNQATVTSGGAEEDRDSATETITCYAPLVTKTAAGAYDERHEWDVEKSVDPVSQDILAGGTGNFKWTVKVTESVFEENFVATGTISVTNPRTDGGEMIVKLTDALNDGVAATITGCTGGTWNTADQTVAVQPDTTAVCAYTASLTYSEDAEAPTNNTVTAELMAGTDHLITTATDAVEWTANVIRASASLDDDQNPDLPPTITDGGTWTYDDSYTCSTNQADYIKGPYTHSEDNTATVTSGDKSDSDSASTNVICHAPVVTKDVATYFNRDWDWTITKEFDGTYNLFAGQSVTHNYRVNVTPTYTDNFWGVKGTITITNSHPSQEMVLNSVSDLAGGITGVVTCPSMVVPAAGTLTCTYDTGPQDAPDANPFGDLNTATAVFADANWTGSAGIDFSATPTTEDEPVITVGDDNLTDEIWNADRAAGEWTYTRDFACSANPADYTDGKYAYSLTNTATINETGQTDTAKVDINCYAPKVTKTAETYWNRDWDWSITKDYDGSYNLFAGDTVTHGYLVKVAPTYTDNFWGVKGTITVYNDHPTEDMTLTSLTDLAGGINGNVTCPSLVVPANGSLICTYDTGVQNSLKGNPFGDTNTATAVFASANWTGTFPIVFSANPTTEDEPIITVDDDNLTDESWSADRAAGEWTYDKGFTCPTDASLYTSGKYTFSHINTAKINETGQTDTATVDVACYWPQVDITKTGDDLSKITDQVSYDITAFNTTPTDAKLRALSCTISDEKIGFNETAVLASGEKAEYLNIPFTIPQTDEDPYINEATVTCQPVSATTPVVGDSTFMVSDTASWNTNLFQPKVEITKTGPMSVTSGKTITYTFTIKNLSSSDSPNLVLNSVSDNVLGDLKALALAAGCDNLAYNGTCTFTKTYTVPVVTINPVSKTNIVTVHYHPAGFPNDVTDSDDHTVVVTPGSQLTNTSFCPLANNQFRLLYHLEAAPDIYRLQSSNPGQFYFNGFYTGEPGSTFTMRLQIPYPFMTQEGAGNPIQVHDGTTLTSSGCYNPTPSLSGYTITTQAMYPTSSAGNQIITPEDYSVKNIGTYTTVTVTGKVPATGMAYVTIHLDYGLKKTSAWKRGNWDSKGTSDDMRSTNRTPQVTILTPQSYTFSRTVGADVWTTTPSSINEIKKFAGFMGFVSEKVTNLEMSNVKVVIYGPTNAVISTLYTDADGYYMLAYKHKAKTATYTIKVPAYNKSVQITVKANSFALANFEVP